MIIARFGWQELAETSNGNRCIANDFLQSETWEVEGRIAYKEFAWAFGIEGNHCRLLKHALCACLARRKASPGVLFDYLRTDRLVLAVGWRVCCHQSRLLGVG